jgi:hypothetical protein
MKSCGFAVFAAGFLAAILALGGCGNVGGQSQLAMPEARSQGSPTDAHDMSGSGQRKVGQFWWVWNTVDMSPRTRGLVNVECPAEYLPTSGGYNYSLVGTQSYYLLILGSYPFHAKSTSGWTISAANGFGTTISLKVWAVCAKTL